jgi:sorbitol/mannitol transport system permease protein
MSMSDALPPVQNLPAAHHSPVSRRQGSRPSARRTAWIRRLPLLPALIYMIVVTQVPFLVTVWYSFRGWNSQVPGSNKFVGFKSYSAVLSDPMFRSAAVVTVEMTASAVILSMLLGTSLAILINRKFRGRGIVRTMLITPFLVIPVATGLLFQTTIYGNYFGILDWIVGWFGISQVTWVSTFALPSVVAVLVWEWTPFMMLIVLAGLQSESLEALEAARVDGANASKPSSRSPSRIFAATSSWGCCSARSTSSRPSGRSSSSPRGREGRMARQRQTLRITYTNRSTTRSITRRAPRPE